VAKVKTRFGGRYVRGVDGVEEHGNRSWFYYVNGYLADPQRRRLPPAEGRPCVVGLPLLA